MAAQPSDEQRVIDIRYREAARALVRTWLADANALTTLRDLLADELAPANLSEWEDDEVLEAVAQRIAWADLTPVYTPRAYRSGEIIAPRQVAQRAVLSAPKELTWIEIKLVDMECDPVPNERYRITTPEGTVREGKLDYVGKARVDDIYDLGECKIEFPDLDADAWRSEVICPEDPLAGRIPFIAFELVDMSGDAVPLERVRVSFPNGDVIETALDEDGRLEYHGCPEGEYGVEFPDLDADAWEAAEQK